jgi:hypothetical protein
MGPSKWCALARPELWARDACLSDRRSLTRALPPPPPQFDLKNRRTFLKRCDYPGVRVADLYVGSIITVYSRQLTIVKYGDTFTARAFEKQTEMCVGPPLAASASLHLALAHLCSPSRVPRLGLSQDNRVRNVRRRLTGRPGARHGQLP